MNSGKCGPFLRMGRLPPQKHEDQCKDDSNCTGAAESCIATLRGLECRSWQDIMVEVFKLGESISFQIIDAGNYVASHCYHWEILVSMNEQVIRL